MSHTTPSLAPAAPLRFDIYGLGNALLDKEFVVHDEFLREQGIAKGAMTLIDEPRLVSLLAQLRSQFGLKGRASGGSAANTLVTASYFGSRAFYSCRVGADEAGSFYLSDLRAAGVGTNPHPGAAAVGAPMTGRCLVMVTPDAERTMNTFLGSTSELSHAEIDFDALASSRLLYIEGYLVTSPSAREAAVRAKAFAREHGIEVAYTLSDSSMLEFFREGVNQIVGEDGVDLLFCNEGEALQWSGLSDVSQAAQALKAVARRFCITLGARGALVFDGQQLLQIASHPVTPVDSNGAGDVFAGAFLHAYAAGLGCRRAGDLASLASAHCVTQFGPRLPAARHLEIRRQVLGADC
ncbi:MAG: adenosine kinase [Betaproteobacteria bacterium]